MRPYARWTVVLALGALPLRSAKAEDYKQACIAASTDGQTLRSQGKLLNASEELALCTHDECPEILRGYCARWLAETEQQIPSIVVRATDKVGADVVDARLLVDGSAAALDGRPIRLDPGPHSVVIEASDGTRQERKLLLAAGDGTRTVTLQLEVTAKRGQEEPVRGPRPPPVQASGGSTAGPWILGGLGAAALATSGYFAYLALGELTKLQEQCAPRCTPSQTAQGRSDALVTDVSLGIGAGAIAGAVIWRLLLPGSGSSSASALWIRPVPGGGVVGFAGALEARSAR